jgi:hypothetical protein
VLSQENHEAHDRSHSTSVFWSHSVPRRNTEILATAPAENDILSVAEFAELLKCRPSSIYNLTRIRTRERYDNPIPVLRLPMGLRFRRSSVLAWLRSQETTNAA